MQAKGLVSETGGSLAAEILDDALLGRAVRADSFDQIDEHAVDLDTGVEPGSGVAGLSSRHAGAWIETSFY